MRGDDGIEIRSLSCEKFAGCADYVDELGEIFGLGDRFISR